MPSVNVILKYHNTTKAVDRHVTPEMFQRIVTKTGIFIPIGTSICRLCREKLFGNNSIEHVEEENTIETNTKNKIAEAEILPP